ncbi:hypothetical protein GE061_001581 [Apolygus lucorum]|uniref:Uncharacterized protein n=1 Tax=Apolygus lucorum TaxID=248454 RepID=A0A8S9Y7G9_APOLU|nr:hypothetical protein GE061_001581 [Apolygus lucorum]
MKKNPENWKVAREKLQRYASAGPPPRTVCCDHKKMNKAFACKEVRSRDIDRFHHKFYSNEGKITQDNFILKYVEGKPTARKRPVNSNRERIESSAGFVVVEKLTSELAFLLPPIG